MKPMIEVSIGEIVDKCTILEIKYNNIKDPEKLKNIQKEYEYLKDKVHVLNIDQTHYSRLLWVNKKLWVLEEEIRRYQNIELDNIVQFITCAKAIHTENDIRAEIKKEINIEYGSNFVEEKSY